VQTEGQAQEEGAMGYKQQGQQPAGKDDNLAFGHPVIRGMLPRWLPRWAAATTLLLATSRGIRVIHESVG
jgi:hypothetical protein